MDFPTMSNGGAGIEPAPTILELLVVVAVLVDLGGAEFQCAIMVVLVAVVLELLMPCGTFLELLVLVDYLLL